MSDAGVSYASGLIQDLADPEEAAAYLNAALEDGDQEIFLLALRNVAEARGMSTVARQARLNRENLYRILSPAGNPQLANLNALLRSVGLRLSVEVDERHLSGAALAEAVPDYQIEDP
jgi:probable addiction module antidote protein